MREQGREDRAEHEPGREDVGVAGRRESTEEPVGSRPGSAGCPSGCAAAGAAPRCRSRRTQARSARPGRSAPPCVGVVAGCDQGDRDRRAGERERPDHERRAGRHRSGDQVLHSADLPPFFRPREALFCANNRSKTPPLPPSPNGGRAGGRPPSSPPPGGCVFTPPRARAAEGRDRAVLRRRRLDGARRVDRRRGAPRASRALLRADEGDRRAPRRHRREVHRRRGDGGLRAAGGARGRRLRALRAAAEIRASSPSSASRGGSASAAARSSRARTSGSRPATPSTSPRGSAGGAAGRDPARRTTLRLARDAIEVEPVEPLALKGKGDPVPAWRLVGLGRGRERRFDQRLVGRERELGALGRLGACASGPAASSSRSSARRASGSHASSPSSSPPADATVVRGRCLSYGRGSPTGRWWRC